LPIELVTVTEIAKEFLIKAGNLFARLEKADFDKSKGQWVLTFDVGFTAPKIKKVIVDDSTKKVIAFE
jgi:hypothetical protein